MSLLPDFNQKFEDKLLELGFIIQQDFVIRDQNIIIPSYVILVLSLGPNFNFPSKNPTQDLAEIRTALTDIASRFGLSINPYELNLGN